MDNELEKKIEKLPKWARDHIKNLERDISNAKYNLNKLKGESEHGCTGKVTRGYELAGGVFALPDDDTYRFKIADRQSFSVRLDNDCLLVTSNGSLRMDIEPRASNAIHIRCRR